MLRLRKKRGGKGAGLRVVWRGRRRRRRRRGGGDGGYVCLEGREGGAGCGGKGEEGCGGGGFGRGEIHEATSMLQSYSIRLLRLRCGVLVTKLRTSIVN